MGFVAINLELLRYTCYINLSIGVELLLLGGITPELLIVKKEYMGKVLFCFWDKMFLKKIALLCYSNNASKYALWRNVE